MGTAGAGLYLCLNPKPGFQRFDRRQGLPDDDVLSILEDQQGFIWLSTGRGLCRLDPDGGSARVFGYHQGLGAMDFNIDAALRLKDGRLAYGSSAGLDLFDPCRLTGARAAIPLYIEGLRINGRRVPLVPPLFLRRRIDLPWSRDIIRFDFAPIDHRQADDLTCRYRLRGWKDQWMETDKTSRQAVFGQLPPGAYKLEVMAYTADGRPASGLQSLQIHIPTPFWRRSWFVALGLLCFVILSYLLIHFLSGYLRIRQFWRKTTCISTYRLGPRIGCGGMADVFAGTALAPPKAQVAVKILREDLCKDPLSRRRFRLEAAIIDQLEHPNIVRVLERGVHDDRPYIVMERLHGVTLAQKIETERRLSLIQTALIVSRICSALEQIHQKGILHRDLKPANIMLTRPAQHEIGVKLLDFGLARIINQSRLTRSGTVMGTLSYLAPEQISRQEASTASDVFALGVLVFETLTGVLPYTGGSAGDLLNQILIEPPPRLEDLDLTVPQEIDTMLGLMLAKNPLLRPTLPEIRLCFSAFTSNTLPRF